MGKTIHAMKLLLYKSLCKPSSYEVPSWHTALFSTYPNGI